ncbi:MAG: GUN4 domain-containing protein [Leptolyngbya sp. SIO1D8]|nr:GUN4 domain-containing protein [Leptolyngbya sp. SIO1D8]
MADPITLTASTIANLAFQEFIKSGAGEMAKKLTEGVGNKISELRKRIVKKLLGENEHLDVALAKAEEGDSRGIAIVAEHLGMAMKKDDTFAQEIRTLAQPIYQQKIQFGNVYGNVYFITNNNHHYHDTPPTTLSSAVPSSCLHRGYDEPPEAANSSQSERGQTSYNSLSTEEMTISSVTEDLSSERFGIDYYAKLYDLLKAGKWKSADEEAAERMLKIMDRRDEGWLRIEDIQKFPCQDLRNIDRLWIKYSQGKFGFSIQKKIYLKCYFECEVQPDEYEILHKAWIWHVFAHRVGWLVEGEWISHEDIIFAPSAPKGHLPVLLDTYDPFTHHRIDTPRNSSIPARYRKPFDDYGFSFIAKILSHPGL